LASQINASNSGFGGIVSTGDSSGELQLQTAGTTALTIDTSQNVGIGTTSPNFRVTFGGQTGATATPLALRFSNDYSNVNTAASSKIFLYNDGSGTDVYGIGVGADSDNQYHAGGTPTNNNGKHRFFTNNTERMRIDPSGHVYIGTTNSAPRDFTSGGGCVIKPPANTFEFATTDTNAVFVNYTGSASGSSTFIVFRQQGAGRGSISTNGSTTAYNTTSDYRLKENIAPMTGALDIVAQLKPSTYTWKETGVNSQGFIAHELAEVVPDCVTGEKDAVETYTDEEGNEKTKIKPQGVDTSFLVATLTAAIQEQQTIINDLKARIETLETK